MNPVFTINFRREVYRRELARQRRRVVLIGAWVTYFGTLALMLGLYGINCASLTQRARRIEFQAKQLQEAQGTNTDLTLSASQLAEVQRVYGSPARWRDKLSRLSSLLPPNVQLLSLSVNPDNLTGATDRNALEIAGQLRGGQDRMGAVVALVSMLQRDSTFAAGYQNIRLASSRSSDPTTAITEFVIECR